MIAIRRQARIISRQAAIFSNNGKRAIYPLVLGLWISVSWVYGEPKSVTVAPGSHAYQTFKTTMAGEYHILDITKASTAPNIAHSWITAQDDQVLWEPAQITKEAATHTYTLTGAQLDTPLWVEFEGNFVKIAVSGKKGPAVTPPSDFKATVLTVEIEEPDGLPVQTIAAGDSLFRYNPSCFEWQFVHVDNERVAYHTTQPIDGLAQPIPPASYNWSVSKGTLNNPTAEKPKYSPNSMPIPATMETVDLKLRAMAGNDIGMQSRTLEVYRDHLERDFQNWGTGDDCGAETAYVYYWTYSRYGKKWHLFHSWNCFGSVWHAFDGTHDGYTTDIPSAGFTVTTYDDPIPWSTAVANLQRGDIVSFYIYDPGTGKAKLEHAHTCMGKSSQMYGANNEPTYGGYIRSDGYGHSAPYWEGGSWRWWLTSSKTYYDQLNAGYESMNPGEGKLLNRIKVHRK